jgi:hypothetical protein
MAILSVPLFSYRCGANPPLKEFKLLYLGMTERLKSGGEIQNRLFSLPKTRPCS